MSSRRFDEFETELDEVNDTADGGTANLGTKLERRRRIEDLEEEKRLREELFDF